MEGISPSCLRLDAHESVKRSHRTGVFGIPHRAAFAGIVERVLTCRTNPRITDAVYGALVVIALVVGVLMLVLGAAYGVLSVAGVGVLFLVIGVQQYRQVLMRTASELSLDPSGNKLYWRAIRDHGELNVADINGVRKSNRPAVYELSSVDGSSIPFWLSQRDGDVQFLFGTLAEMNPSIDMSGLYRKSMLWWKGLPNP